MLAIEHRRLFGLSGEDSFSSRSLLGPRMSLFINLQQTRGADVGIDLSRDQTLVSQKFLDAANIRAGVQQMRGETVPQRVGRSASIEPGFLDVLFQHPSDASRRNPATETIGEYG